MVDFSHWPHEDILYVRVSWLDSHRYGREICEGQFAFSTRSVLFDKFLSALLPYAGQLRLEFNFGDLVDVDGTNKLPPGDVLFKNADHYHKILQDLNGVVQINSLEQLNEICEKITAYSRQFNGDSYDPVA